MCELHGTEQNAQIELLDGMECGRGVANDRDIVCMIVVMGWFRQGLGCHDLAYVVYNGTRTSRMQQGNSQMTNTLR